MKKILSVFLFGLFASMLVASEPKTDFVFAAGDPVNHTVQVGDDTFYLAPREQLRLTSGDVGYAHLPIRVGTNGQSAAEPVPDAFDWTNDEKTKFPTLGNNKVGNCYYVACAHQAQTWVGAATKMQVDFNENQLIARYRVLSRGDNGLSDSDIFGSKHNGEFYSGVVGPKGPYKILDHLLVKPTDTTAIAYTMYNFGGLMYTASLCNEWVSNIKPGMVWDKGRANDGYGHAIIINAKNPDKTMKVQSWGLSPAIKLTQAGLESSKPELITMFSMSWFDPKTGYAPNGLHYTELAARWKTIGGRDLPASPFPDPVQPQPTPPTPPGPFPPVPDPVVPPGPGFTGSLVYKDGVLVRVLPGATAVEDAIAGHKELSPAAVASFKVLISDLRANKSKDVLFADVMKLLLDLK